MRNAGRAALLRCVPATLLVSACAVGQSLLPGGAPPAPPRQPVPQTTPRAPEPPPPLRQRLEIGDLAPSLKGVRWLRGEPVAEFARGTTYVLEFWAPWCPYCREALPLYANLSQRYSSKKVRVLGLAVWPKKSTPDMARDFVSDAEDLFPYAVGEDTGNTLAQAWLTAADVKIPTGIIVDTEGRIAWIGDPREGMESALSRLLGDKARAEEVLAGRSVYMQEMEGAKSAAVAGDWESAAELTLKLYEANPINLPDFAARHYVALVMLGDHRRARAFGERLLTKDFVIKPIALNLLAWDMVEPGGAIPKEKLDLDLALRAATLADELTAHRNAYILDTLARVQFLRGDLATALSLQLRAVDRSNDLNPKDPEAAAVRKELRERLDQYQAAADAADDASSPDRR